MSSDYIAIQNGALIAQGSLTDIITQVKTHGGTIEPFLLERDSFKRIDIDWHGSADEVISRLQPQAAPVKKGRGRPKLGVTAKEVTLLPRHWQWLASQRGGASVTLRRLVEHAMKHTTLEQRITEKQNQLYSLLSVFADEPGFEEASRALYRNSKASFLEAINSWPEDIQSLLIESFDKLALLHEQGDGVE